MNYLSGLLGGEKRGGGRGIWQTCGAGSSRDHDAPPAAASVVVQHPSRVVIEKPRQRAVRGATAAVRPAAASGGVAKRSYSSQDNWNTAGEWPGDTQVSVDADGPCGDFVAAHPERLFCTVTGRDLLKQHERGGSTSTAKCDIGPITLHYFEVGPFLGRGGKIRAYLLSRQVVHSCITYKANKWTDMRERVVRAGISPRGNLPAVTHAGFGACETGAVLRYLARLLGEVGQQPQADCLADMSYESLAYWCDDLQRAVWAWVTKDVQGTAAAEQYAWLDLPAWSAEDQRRNSAASMIPRLVWEYFMLRESFYQDAEYLANIGAPGPPTLSPGCETLPSWVDCVVFATMHDDMTIAHAVREFLGAEGMQRVAAAMVQSIYREDEFNQEARLRRQKKVQKDVFFSASEVFERYPRLAAIYDNVFNLPLVREMLMEVERIRRQQQEDYTWPPAATPAPPPPASRLQPQLYQVYPGDAAAVAAASPLPPLAPSPPVPSPSESDPDSMTLVVQSAYRLEEHNARPPPLSRPAPGCLPGSVIPGLTSTTQLMAPSTPDRERLPRPHALVDPGCADLPSRSPGVQAGAAMARPPTPVAVAGVAAAAPHHHEETTTTGSSAPVTMAMQQPHQKMQTTEFSAGEWAGGNVRSRAHG